LISAILLFLLSQKFWLAFWGRRVSSPTLNVLFSCFSFIRMSHIDYSSLWPLSCHL
jgi:hypothetical protein